MLLDIAIFQFLPETANSIVSPPWSDDNVGGSLQPEPQMVAFNISPVIESLLRRVFGDDLDRSALEALAIEGYRTARLTAGEVARLLGKQTSIEAQEWLASRGVPLNYALEDLESDRETLGRLFPEPLVGP
jgi:predicted HTH domain antitoxin